jgi:hypothetical protein
MNWQKKLVPDKMNVTGIFINQRNQRGNVWTFFNAVDMLQFFGREIMTIKKNLVCLARLLFLEIGLKQISCNSSCILNNLDEF